MTRFAIVAALWNPLNHPSLATNFSRWLESLPVHPEVEVWIALIGQTSEIIEQFQQRARFVRFSASDNIWCIESARNAIIRRHLRHVDFVICSDADLVFEDPCWWKIVQSTLQDYPLIQGFQTGLWQDSQGNASYSRQSIMWGHCNNRLSGWPSTCENLYHVGFCWAARRDLWEEGNPGIPDWVCFGANDRALALACTNHQHHKWTGWWRARLDAYTADLHRWMGKEKPGYVPLTVRHLWHGNVRNRRYSERSDHLAKVDWPRHCRYNEDGLLAWTDEGHKLHNEWFKQTMILRQNED